MRLSKAQLGIHLPMFLHGAMKVMAGRECLETHRLPGNMCLSLGCCPSLEHTEPEVSHWISHEGWRMTSKQGGSCTWRCVFNYFSIVPQSVQTRRASSDTWRSFLAGSGHSYVPMEWQLTFLWVMGDFFGCDGREHALFVLFFSWDDPSRERIAEGVLTEGSEPKVSRIFRIKYLVVGFSVLFLIWGFQNPYNLYNLEEMSQEMNPSRTPALKTKEKWSL